jgi:hypothetical protein
VRDSLGHSDVDLHRRDARQRRHGLQVDRDDARG